MATPKTTTVSSKVPKSRKRLRLSISPGKLTTALILLVTIIMVATIFSDNLDLPKDINRFLNVGKEKSFPTWYSSIALLFCSLLLVIIAKYKRAISDTFTRQWSLLAIIFLFMSIDEIAALHELATVPTREALNTGGIFYFAWVIPAGILVILFGFYFLRFILHLDPNTRMLFLASAFLLLSGALLIEMIAASLYVEFKAGLRPVLLYEKVTELEEFFEMAGVVLFI